MRAMRSGRAEVGRGLVLAGVALVTIVVDQGTASADPGVQIAGTVFHDLNSDGQRQGGEPGIEGATIQLQDEDGNFVASTTTGDNGTYFFGDLEPGTYQVVEVSNPDGYSDNTTDDVIVLDLAGVVSDADFGNTSAFGDVDENIELDGRVWIDEDRDGDFDADEVGATDVSILVSDANGEPLVYLVPDDDGHVYWFGDGGGGTVTVTGRPPSGFEGTTGLTRDVAPGGSGYFEFGVAEVITTTTTRPPTTTTTTPGTTAPPATDPPVVEPPSTTPTTTGGGATTPTTAAPTTSTTTPPLVAAASGAVNQPIRSALSPVPNDPNPRLPTTTVAVEVAGIQSARLATTGRDSTDTAASGATLLGSGLVATFAAAILRRRGSLRTRRA